MTNGAAVWDPTYPRLFGGSFLAISTPIFCNQTMIGTYLTRSFWLGLCCTSNTFQFSSVIVLPNYFCASSMFFVHYQVFAIDVALFTNNPFQRKCSRFSAEVELHSRHYANLNWSGMGNGAMCPRFCGASQVRGAGSTSGSVHYPALPPLCRI